MRTRNYSMKYYHQVHSRLWRRLARTAFNNYYKCSKCGSHSNLEIHIPDMNSFSFNRPGSWMIVCSKCHKLL